MVEDSKDNMPNVIRNLDILQIVEGTKYSDIFSKIGEKGLMDSAVQFAHENITALSEIKAKSQRMTKPYSDNPHAPEEVESDVNDPTEYQGMTIDEQESATNAILKEPLSLAMQQVHDYMEELEEEEDFHLDLNKYDPKNMNIDSGLMGQLEEMDLFEAVAHNAAANIPDELLSTLEPEEKSAFRTAYKKLLESDIGKAYIAHAFLSTLTAMDAEQLFSMGGVEEMMTEEEIEPQVDVTDEMDWHDQSWQDKLERSDKGDGWFKVLRSSGPVMSSGGGTSDLFNTSFGVHIIKPKKKPFADGTLWDDAKAKCDKCGCSDGCDC